MADHILIVDDDPGQRDLLAQHVRHLGYAPLTAEDGDRAVAILDARDPAQIACMILDLVMPGLDGLGVLAHLRRTGLRLPVIVQTGHGGIDNAISAMRAGAIDFLVKPVRTDRLAEALRSALSAATDRAHDGRHHESRAGRAGSNTEILDAAISDITIVPASAPAQPHDMLPLLDKSGHVRSLDDLEAEIIRFAITRYGGQMSEVARRLRIGRSTLYRRLDTRSADERDGCATRPQSVVPR